MDKRTSSFPSRRTIYFYLPIGTCSWRITKIKGEKLFDELSVEGEKKGIMAQFLPPDKWVIGWCN